MGLYDFVRSKLAALQRRVHRGVANHFLKDFLRGELRQADQVEISLSHVRLRRLHFEVARLNALLSGTPLELYSLFVGALDVEFPGLSDLLTRSVKASVDTVEACFLLRPIEAPGLADDAPLPQPQPHAVPDLDEPTGPLSGIRSLNKLLPHIIANMQADVHNLTVRIHFGAETLGASVLENSVRSGAPEPAFELVVELEALQIGNDAAAAAAATAAVARTSSSGAAADDLSGGDAFVDADDAHAAGDGASFETPPSAGSWARDGAAARVGGTVHKTLRFGGVRVRLREVAADRKPFESPVSNDLHGRETIVFKSHVVGAPDADTLGASVAPPSSTPAASTGPSSTVHLTRDSQGSVARVSATLALPEWIVALQPYQVRALQQLIDEVLVNLLPPGDPLLASASLGLNSSVPLMHRSVRLRSGAPSALASAASAASPRSGSLGAPTPLRAERGNVTFRDLATSLVLAGSAIAGGDDDDAQQPQQRRQQRPARGTMQRTLESSLAGFELALDDDDDADGADGADLDALSGAAPYTRRAPRHSRAPVAAAPVSPRTQASDSRDSSSAGAGEFARQAASVAAAAPPFFRPDTELRVALSFPSLRVRLFDDDRQSTMGYDGPDGMRLDLKSIEATVTRAPSGVFGAVASVHAIRLDHRFDQVAHPIVQLMPSSDPIAPALMLVFPAPSQLSLTMPRAALHVNPSTLMRAVRTVSPLIRLASTPSSVAGSAPSPAVAMPAVNNSSSELSLDIRIGVFEAQLAAPSSWPGDWIDPSVPMRTAEKHRLEWIMAPHPFRAIVVGRNVSCLLPPASNGGAPSIELDSLRFDFRMPSSLDNPNPRSETILTAASLAGSTLAASSGVPSRVRVDLQPRRAELADRPLPAHYPKSPVDLFSLSSGLDLDDETVQMRLADADDATRSAMAALRALQAAVRQRAEWNVRVQVPSVRASVSKEQYDCLMAFIITMPAALGLVSHAAQRVAADAVAAATGEMQASSVMGASATVRRGASLGLGESLMQSGTRRATSAAFVARAPPLDEQPPVASLLEASATSSVLFESTEELPSAAAVARAASDAWRSVPFALTVQMAHVDAVLSEARAAVPTEPLVFHGDMRGARLFYCPYPATDDDALLVFDASDLVVLQRRVADTAALDAERVVMTRVPFLAPSSTPMLHVRLLMPGLKPRVAGDALQAQTLVQGDALMLNYAMGPLWLTRVADYFLTPMALIAPAASPVAAPPPVPKTSSFVQLFLTRAAVRYKPVMLEPDSIVYMDSLEFKTHTLSTSPQVTYRVVAQQVVLMLIDRAEHVAWPSADSMQRSGASVLVDSPLVASEASDSPAPGVATYRAPSLRSDEFLAGAKAAGFVKVLDDALLMLDFTTRPAGMTPSFEIVVRNSMMNVTCCIDSLNTLLALFGHVGGSRDLPEAWRPTPPPPPPANDAATSLHSTPVDAVPNVSDAPVPIAPVDDLFASILMSAYGPRPPSVADSANAAAASTSAKAASNADSDSSATSTAPPLPPPPLVNAALADDLLPSFLCFDEHYVPEATSESIFGPVVYSEPPLDFDRDGRVVIDLAPGEGLSSLLVEDYMTAQALLPVASETRTCDTLVSLKGIEVSLALFAGEDWCATRSRPLGSSSRTGGRDPALPRSAQPAAYFADTPVAGEFGAAALELDGATASAAASLSSTAGKAAAAARMRNDYFVAASPPPDSAVYTDVLPTNESKRQFHNKMLLQLHDLNVAFELFGERNAVASALEVQIGNVDVVSRMERAPADNLLSSLRQSDQRAGRKFMVTLRLASVRPNIERPSAVEARLEVSLAPLRIHLHERHVEFVRELLEYTAPASAFAERFVEGDPLYFQRVLIHPLHVVIDYTPISVQFGQLFAGDLAQALNMVNWTNIPVDFPLVRLHAVDSSAQLVALIASQYGSFIFSTQVTRIASKIPVLEPLVNVGLGFADLVRVPLEHQRAGRSVWRGIRAGFASFASRVFLGGSGLVTMAADAASGALNRADMLVAVDPLFEPQFPQPHDMSEAGRQVAATVTQNLESARRAFSQPAQLLRAGQTSDGLRRLVLAMPSALLRTARALTTAVSRAGHGAAARAESLRRAEASRQ